MAGILAQPGLHIDPFRTAALGAVGYGLTVAAKWIEGRYAKDAPAPAGSFGVLPLLLIGLLTLATSCTWHESEPAAPALGPGRPHRVASVTDNRPIRRYLRRSRAKHRKPASWH